MQHEFHVFTISLSTDLRTKFDLIYALFRTLAEESPQKYSECHQNQSISVHEPLPFALLGNTR